MKRLYEWLPRPLSLVLLMCQGCGTMEEDRQEEIRGRQDSAFDVSGSYFEEIRQGVPSTLQLDNERGYYDINGLLTIRRPFDADELAALDAGMQEIVPGISDRQIDAVIKALHLSFTNIHLGDGDTMAARGGESVPLDPQRSTAEIVLHSAIENFKTVMVGQKQFHIKRNLKVYLSSRRYHNLLTFSLTDSTDLQSRAIDGQKGFYLELSAAEGRQARVFGPLRLNINQLNRY